MHDMFLPSVTGQANFCMERTSLIVGGFTQPSVARSIIEPHIGAERGFCQRFLWIFPKPIFGHLKTLSDDEDDVCLSVGKPCTHPLLVKQSVMVYMQVTLSISSYIINVKYNYVSPTHNGWLVVEMELVDLLERIWVDGGGEKPVDRMWLLRPESADFEDRFNKTQDNLDDVCGMDDFVTGK